MKNYEILFLSVKEKLTTEKSQQKSGGYGKAEHLQSKSKSS
jgi:hypothetical protein